MNAKLDEILERAKQFEARADFGFALPALAAVGEVGEIAAAGIGVASSVASNVVSASSSVASGVQHTIEGVARRAGDADSNDKGTTGILFAGPGGVFAGPGPCVLLVHPTGMDHAGTWTLPDAADEVGDFWLDGPVPLGDALLARCDVQFTPTLTAKHDRHTWCTGEFARDFRHIINPSAFALIEKFSAGEGAVQSTGESTMESRSEFTAAQAKADRVAQMFGDSAPPPLQGESLLNYRSRLASKYQAHSKAYKDSDLSKVGDPIALSMVEDAIYLDAAREAEHPTHSLRPGELRPMVRLDGAGRPITKYAGNGDGACWDQFNPPQRFVRRFNLGAASR
jgi:hypothetical protein